MSSSNFGGWSPMDTGAGIADDTPPAIGRLRVTSATTLTMAASGNGPGHLPHLGD